MDATMENNDEVKEESNTVPIRMRVPRDIWRRFKALYPDHHSTHFIITGLLKQHVTKAEQRRALNQPVPVDPFVDTE